MIFLQYSARRESEHKCFRNFRKKNFFKRKFGIKICASELFPKEKENLWIKTISIRLWIW